jgi:cystathionine beta-lyase/cystathionine gamma-synthase
MATITSEDVASYLRAHGYVMTLSAFEFESKTKLSSTGNNEIMDVATKIISYNPCENDPYGSTNMPIYQTATFKQPGSS